MSAATVTRAARREARRRLGSAWPVVHDVFVAVREHGLGVYTTAIAFRVLVSLVPLTLLGIGLLGAFGLDDVWKDTVFPELEKRLSQPVAQAIDYVANDIFETGGPWLILFACVLFLYDTALGVRMAQRSLNAIHRVDEQRGSWRAAAAVVALAVACDLLFLAAFGAVVAGGRLDGWVLEVARWPVALVLLGAGVGLLLRYAPSEQPEPRWASLGGAVIVCGWLVASALFGVWVTSVASYKSAIGNLTAFLVLTAYTLVVSGIFVFGAQLDETLRTQRNGRSRSA